MSNIGTVQDFKIYGENGGTAPLIHNLSNTLRDW